jgi:hypothetical protein
MNTNLECACRAICLGRPHPLVLPAQWVGAGTVYPCLASFPSQ